jgi:hypothetical protein
MTARTGSQAFRLDYLVCLPVFVLVLVLVRPVWLGVPPVLAGQPRSKAPSPPQTGPELPKEASSEPLRLRVEMEPETLYVGQGAVLAVSVVGDDRPPRIEPFQIPDAEVWTIGEDLKPVSSTGIGPVISQTNLHLLRYRVVPRKAGTLEIPSLLVEQGGRAGRSQPLRRLVVATPMAGRSSTFLGGVGSFSIAAEANPRTLRVGQAFEYRLRIEGPAAWGITGPPRLDRFDRLPLGLEIVPLPDLRGREPPSYTFVFRVRATQAGDAVLPPIRVSSFDPKPGRYTTRASNSVAIRVVDVPAFDPDSIDYQAPEVSEANPQAETAPFAWTRMAVLGGLVSLAFTLLVVALWLRLRRRRRRSTTKGLNEGNRLGEPPSWREVIRFAARSARRLESFPRGEFDGGSATGTLTQELASQILASMTRLLELGIGRPPGALTPDEAAHGMEHLTGSAELAAEARGLAFWCDQVLYAAACEPAMAQAGAIELQRETDPENPRRPGSPGSVKERAIRLFEAIARQRRPTQPETGPVPVLPHPLAMSPEPLDTNEFEDIG